MKTNVHGTAKPVPTPKTVGEGTCRAAAEKHGVGHLANACDQGAHGCHECPWRHEADNWLGRFSVKGENLARGVVCCLVAGGQSFSFSVVDVAGEIYEVFVTAAGVRYLPACCVAVRSASAE